MTTLVKDKKTKNSQKIKDRFISAFICTCLAVPNRLDFVLIASSIQGHSRQRCFVLAK
jgi:hypothetical protein